MTTRAKNHIHLVTRRKINTFIKRTTAHLLAKNWIYATTTTTIADWVIRIEAWKRTFQVTRHHKPTGYAIISTSFDPPI